MPVVGKEADSFSFDRSSDAKKAAPTNGATAKQVEFDLDSDDFYAELDTPVKATKVDNGATQRINKSSKNNKDDDFFAALDDELQATDTNAATTEEDDTTDSGSDIDVGGEEGSSVDIFAALQADVFGTVPELTDAPKKKASPKTPKKPTKPALETTPKASPAPPANGSSSPSGGMDSGDLSKKTIPILKEMLREKGLKVSGKKAELIERLMTS